MAIVQRGSVLTPADIATFDRWGHGVSLSGDGGVLVAGSFNKANQGRVYTFDSSGGAYTQRGSAIAAFDAGSTDYFGYDVAISANGLVMAVGAPQWEGTATNQGGVYIYDWDSGTSAWVLRGSVLVAADAASYDYFGSSVDLSGDGAILVVGARSWEGTTSDQGGVYIYDWSGSTWVQRGSVLVSPTPASTRYFGNRAKLSNDGLVLAVAEYNLSGTVYDSGVVYVFDWSGSAWVQRGSFIEAADAASEDEFGYGMDLSGNGLVLAVGAPKWEGTLTDQGCVYVYDWDTGTSAWVQRGSVLVAADAEASDNFGAAIALSTTAAVMVVDAMQWDYVPADNAGGVYVYDVAAENTGTPVASTSLTIELATGIAVAATDLTVTATGPAEAATTLTIEPALGAAVGATALTVYPSAPAVAATALTVYPSAPVVAATALTVSWPTGTPTAATALTVTATGPATAATLLAVLGAPVVPGDPAAPAQRWTARCVIGGTDVSARLVGKATVTAAEGAARIASIVMLPASGPIAPMDYVGKSITLDYVQVIGGAEVARRLFTGRVDTPAYDLAMNLLTLTCTDDLQNIVATLPRSTIDHLIGGRYTEAVQGDLDDGWDYAQARLTTVAGCLDASASGGMRTTLWESATTWATFTAADLIYQRSHLTLPQRSTLINKVDISFDYRYTRLHQRTTTMGWSGALTDMAPNGYQYPTQQDIVGAAEGTGWTITRSWFWPAPAAIEVIAYNGPYIYDGFIYPPAGSIDMAVLHLAHRHSQTITERYTITLTSHGSVAANGELPTSMRGALASNFSGSTWESALDVEPLMLGETISDYAPDASRADADYAIQALLDQARTKILASHRTARVANAILCNPDLDVDKHVAIDTAQLSASGKVAEVVHVLDFAAGSAVSEFSIGLFGAGGDAGEAPPPLVPPPPRLMVDHSLDWVSAIPPLLCHTYGTGAEYSENMMGLLLNPPKGYYVEDTVYFYPLWSTNQFYVDGSYPVTGFRMMMPGVADADRNPIDDPISATYSIDVPAATLSIAVP